MNIARLALALFFIVTGANHFLSPNVYLAIMPPYLPWHVQFVAISGAAEIAGGVGVLFPVTRKLAGVCLIVLLIAVLPANIQSISTGVVIADHAVPDWILWFRLPLQAVFIIWVYCACLRRKA